MRVGGPASFFCEINSEEDLQEAVSFAKKKNLPVFILGGGSNIIVRDEGFNGVVIHMNLKGVSFGHPKNKVVRVEVSAGENWDDFVKQTVERNLHGLENLSFIPGLVGAAPVQNIGAYGFEVGGTIREVLVFDITTAVIRSFKNKECSFSYRNSIFKQNPHLIILKVVFELIEGGETNIHYKDLAEYFKNSKKPPTIRAVRDAVVLIRKAKLADPRDIGTVGSFFKNPILTKERYAKLCEKYPDLPGYTVYKVRSGVSRQVSGVKIPLAWVLDRICGLKGLRKGNVGLYKTQPLVLVNYGGATAEEIEMFARDIQKKVFDMTHITPEYEISFVGKS